jgi:hypothetical protein
MDQTGLCKVIRKFSTMCDRRLNISLMLLKPLVVLTQTFINDKLLFIKLFQLVFQLVCFVSVTYRNSWLIKNQNHKKPFTDTLYTLFWKITDHIFFATRIITFLENLPFTGSIKLHWILYLSYDKFYILGLCLWKIHGM